MTTIDSCRVLPHEMAFGLFVGLTLVRLAPACGWQSPMLVTYAVMLVTLIVATLRIADVASTTMWRLRLALYPLLVNIAYFTLGGVIPRFQPIKRDLLLQSLDAWLIGGNASLWMERFANPFITEILSFCYLAFFPFLVLSLIHYFSCELPVLRQFVMGMFTIYGLGFLGYTLIPAQGPHLDPHLAWRFHEPLVGGWFTQFNAKLVREGSNRVDAFPSLHCAITAFTLLFDRIHARQRFKIWLLPVIGVWIATLYLRYHYFVDVVAGMVLALAAFTMVRHPKPSPLP